MNKETTPIENDFGLIKYFCDEWGCEPSDTYNTTVNCKLGSDFRWYKLGLSKGFSESAKIIAEKDKEIEKLTRRLAGSDRLFTKTQELLKKAVGVIDYYAPILEERLSCGAFARQFQKQNQEALKEILK